MLVGVSENKRELAGKFILAILKLEMNPEYIRYYDSVHLSYHM